MAITITTPASSARLTSLEFVKAELDLTDSTQDLELRRIIDQASNFIVSYCNRPFAKETLTETLGAAGDNILMLERTPIVSVNQISFDGTTIGSTTYEIDDAKAGFLFREIGWQGTQIWRHDITLQPTHRTRKKWSVGYTAGYICHASTESDDTTLPEDIERAATDLVKSWHLSRSENPNIKSQRTGDASESLFDGTNKGEGGIPPSVTRLLAHYRRIT
jgi:hypothetical protein